MDEEARTRTETERYLALLERIATALEAQITPQPIHAITFDEFQSQRVEAFQALAKAFDYDEEASKNIRIVGEDRYQEMSKAFDDAMKIVLSYRRATQMLLGKTFR